MPQGLPGLVVCRTTGTNHQCRVEAPRTRAEAESPNVRKGEEAPLPRTTTVVLFKNGGAPGSSCFCFCFLLLLSASAFFWISHFVFFLSSPIISVLYSFNPSSTLYCEYVPPTFQTCIVFVYELIDPARALPNPPTNLYPGNSEVRLERSLICIISTVRPQSCDYAGRQAISGESSRAILTQLRCRTNGKRKMREETSHSDATAVE